MAGLKFIILFKTEILQIKFTIIEFFLVLLVSNSVMASDICRKDNLGGLVDYSGELFKKATIQRVEKNTFEFCRKSILMRFLSSQKLPYEVNESWSIDRLEAEADKASKNLMTNSWEYTLISTENSRKKSMLMNIGGEASDPTKVFSKLDSNTPLENDRVNLWLSSLTQNEAATKAVSSLKLVGACVLDAPFSVPSCNRALKKVETRMLPKGNHADVTDIDLWKRVLGSNQYDEGLRLMALKMQKRIDNPTNDHNSNVFDDMQESFLKSGMRPDQAKEAAFDTLGFISNHGPNSGIFSMVSVAKATPEGEKMAGHAIHQSTKGLAIGFIASAMSYLDLKTTKAGMKMYSFPSNVESTCDSGKPYHFWMMAYLSRTLVKKDNVRPEIAARAAFIAEKGYQLNRNVASMGTQGHAANSILSAELFSPTHQVIRADLAYAAAGAVYGSQSDNKSLSLNIDDGVKALVNNASSKKIDPSTSTNFINTFLNWNKLFSPNSAFDVMN